MRPIRVTFSDGTVINTEINGTDEEVRRHYLGNVFNFGDTDAHPKDKLVTAVKVEFLCPNFGLGISCACQSCQEAQTELEKNFN